MYENKDLFSVWNWRCPRRLLATWTLHKSDRWSGDGNANIACLLQVFWQEWTNLIHSLLSVRLPSSLAPSRFVPATQSSQVSHLFITLTTDWKRTHAVGRRRQDMPFVSQQRTCLAQLLCKTRCQTKRHSVQEMQASCTFVHPPKTPSPSFVDSASILSHCSPPL